MNPFSRIKNLYKIQKVYELIRNLIEKPELRKDKKHWSKLLKELIGIQEVKEMIDWLKGKKSYIVSALIAAVQLAFMMGYIDEATRDALLALLGAGAISTVAAKMNRISKKMDGSVD
jgi:hypothetical protein